MHEHDRKLDRAEIERIELMEVCPVCGEQRRNNARFCTTCGHRFATDEIENTPLAPSPVTAGLGFKDSADPVISGWPAPAAQVTNSPWAPPAEEKSGWPAPPTGPAAFSEVPEVTRAEAAQASVSEFNQPPSPAESSISDQVAEEIVIAETFDADDSLEIQQSQAHLRLRARTLLQELQETLDGLTGAPSSVDNTIASALEISLIRPAALEGDAIADLRAAAEAAQTRPRDLDTLTALTAQADTIQALIVGYERTTAGIERAINGLRGEPLEPVEE